MLMMTPPSNWNPRIGCSNIILEHLIDCLNCMVTLVHHIVKISSLPNKATLFWFQKNLCNRNLHSIIMLTMPKISTRRIQMPENHNLVLHRNRHVSRMFTLYHYISPDIEDPRVAGEIKAAKTLISWTWFWIATVLWKRIEQVLILLHTFSKQKE
jgi:hypothetical protein